MAAVARTYLPGYTGSFTIDAVVYDTTGWSADGDPGLYDVTTDTSGGWSKEEPGIQKVVFHATIMAKTSQPVPTLKQGDILPGVFKIYNVIAYGGDVVVAKVSTKNDLKGNVTYDIDANSYGIMTGSMAPSVTTVPTGS